MEYRQLGASGLRVSTLSLGTALFGGGHPEIGNLGFAEAREQVEIALSAGVNMFDTADSYSGGLAEEMLGAALQGRRQDAIIATKVFTPVGDGPNDLGLSRAHLLQACEDSLRRLRTDYIDVYQMHGWDGQTPLEETLSALDYLVRSGKVRYIGVSNYSAWQLMKALGISERKELARFVCQQIYYSLQAREAEFELVPIALDQGVGIVVWSPLAGGLLSGKWRRNSDMPAQSRRLNGWPDPPIYDEEQLWDTIDVLVEVAADHGVSPAQVALAYLLCKAGVASVVVGARTNEQLLDNLKAADLVLSDDESERLDKVSTPRLLYPYWWQAKYDKRLGPVDLAVLGPYVAQPPPPGSIHRPLPGFGSIPGQADTASPRQVKAGEGG